MTNKSERPERPISANRRGAFSAEGSAKSQDAQAQVDAQRQEFRATLGRVLADDVIPRVLEAQEDLEPHVRARRQKLTHEERSVFLKAVVSGQAGDALAFVETQRANGVSLRALCLGLFSAVACELGVLWEEDQISFADVSMGLGTLHMLVHQCAAIDGAAVQVEGQRTIALASSPEEQHAFGLLLVSKIFEMEGWGVTGGPELHTGPALHRLVQNIRFDVIGLTASSRALALSLKAEISGLRNISKNPDVIIMVGGSGFHDEPELSDEIGADALAFDAQDAVMKAARLLPKPGLQSSGFHH